MLLEYKEALRIQAPKAIKNHRYINSVPQQNEVRGNSGQGRQHIAFQEFKNSSINKLS